mmetsp:Transcript_16042/g.41576  ORF Transcript_16042/g.41576 Transcript_16042/m.41576 type:complete len:294 (-) Transcript_16042:984-1865(-)|eukprot:CAMPEP_0182921206 /NCGR_PEP_ID=MMETSP0105_2-20130417/3994_1 /TAXON_ID=81532 ORGANISM="Acanthoeca-like sp., Strain 10tr" /NCGR_SAMPLE_ID=MMETSP0105_2 /ASSEMBLY_ACC=CAM_ASM_000205 /LENGTH=293 /DNA_ID=CAMNT_0025058705 /DNA_START=466 /DNA_END=1347 /DNA_ORIENTATION=-
MPRGGGKRDEKFTEKFLASLAKGLELNGATLPPPRMHPVMWTDGQKFTMEDDPDRMSEAWAPPEFVKKKDPIAQRAKTTVENVLPGGADFGDHTMASVVHNVLDPEDCAELIKMVNVKGFTPALLNIGRGRQQLYPGIRDGHRVIVDSADLAGWIFEVVKPALPAKLHGSKVIELNERCRFLCYTPGQEFAEHCDGRYVRPHGHPHAGDYSMVTAQIYLHDVPEENGGATTFKLGKNEVPFQPRVGSILLFTQNLLHEGSLVKSGLKYTLRTEAMYRREPLGVAGAAPGGADM